MTRVGGPGTSGAPELTLDLAGVEADARAATPTLGLRAVLRRADGGPVQCVLLTATVTIADGRGLVWARAGATVPTFRGATEVLLALPCAQVAAVAAPGGDVPLDLGFDGTVFYPAGDGSPRIEQLPWRHRAAFTLPHRTWRELMERDPMERDPAEHDPAGHHGGDRWLRLDDACYGRLAAYRERRAHSSFDAAVDELLHRAGTLRDEEERTG